MSDLSRDAIRGVLLGTAVGDALGMPVEGLSHSNVRTYYKGIKEYRDDDQRGDLEAGQWTDDTQMTLAVAGAVAAAPDDPDVWPQGVADRYVDLQDQARRWGATTTAAIERLADGTPPEDAGSSEQATDGAAMRAAPLGLWWASRDKSREAAFEAICPVLSVTHRHPAALAAGWGQAFAVQHVVGQAPEAFDRDAFWSALTDATAWGEEQLGADDRVSRRLRSLSDHLDAFPLDLGDRCDGVSVRAADAWPFACAMFARRPHLLENSLLSGINVGGDADTTGAMMGALFGALHGWEAFPDEWKEGLEDVDRLTGEADSLAKSLQNTW